MTTHDKIIEILTANELINPHLVSDGHGEFPNGYLMTKKDAEKIALEIGELLRDEIARYHGIKEELFRAFGNFCKALSDQYEK